MDDANVPSLLSLPYLGFLEKDNWAYKKTKKTILSRQNPYYAQGQNFSGTGWVPVFDFKARSLDIDREHAVALMSTLGTLGEFLSLV